MLRRRILVEERGRFALFFLENCRKIDKGSSWISRDFWSSSKSRRRTVVLRFIFTLGQNKFHSDSVISAYRGWLNLERFWSFHLRLNQYKQVLNPRLQNNWEQHFIARITCKMFNPSSERMTSKMSIPVLRSAGKGVQFLMIFD